MRYIAIEGVDGAGKSTLVDRLSEHYAKTLHVVKKIKEPGYMLPDLRSLILAPDFPLTPAGREIVLQADRALMSAQLKKWQDDRSVDVVITDRSFLSGRVYSSTHDVNRELVRTLEKSALWRYPDLILFLNLNSNESYRRISERGAALTYEEQGGLARAHQIHSAFLKQVQSVTESAVRTINCDGKSKDEVFAEAVSLIVHYYGGKNGNA